MICQQCGQGPATVHVTDVLKKSARTRHICDDCARAHDLLPDTPPANAPGEAPDPALETSGGAQPINLQALVHLVFGRGEADGAAPLTCPGCGVKYTEFRADGRFGCPADYDAFRAELLPLLERIHRAVPLAHAGKAPRAAGRRAELVEARAQLARAVWAEDYEHAAILREAIRGKEATG